MAKKNKGPKVSKSQAIRNYMESHPEVGPKAVAAALSKPGYKISAAFVSTIKSSDRRKVKHSLSGIGRIGRNSKAVVSVEGLLLAKKLTVQMGGVNQAKAALDAYAKLVS